MDEYNNMTQVVKIVLLICTKEEDMKAKTNKSFSNQERLEHLMYESFLNSIEEAFKNTKTGIRHTDAALLKFADQIIGKFAAIYANTRSEELGRQAQEIILASKQNYN